MDTKTRYLTVAVLALMSGLMLRSCLRHGKVGSLPVTKDFPVEDTARVAIKGQTLVVETPTKKEYRYVPEEGQAVVDVTHKGISIVTVKNKGFTAQIGVSALLCDKLRLGVDYEFLYWNRFGTVVGVGFGANPIAVGYVGLLYQLDQLHLRNTSLLFGYTTQRNFAVGLRISF